MERTPTKSTKSTTSMLKFTVCALWMIAGMGTGGNALAQDAHALLMKSLHTYNSLSSYSGKGTQDVEIRLANGRRQNISATSSELLYKRPNKLVLKMVATKGSADIYSDGSKMIVYRSAAQKYTTGPTASTINAMLPLLLQRAGIGTVLDPLAFLSNSTPPSGLVNLKALPDAKVNGRAVSVLAGTWQMAPADKGKRVTNPFTVQGSRWTLYIDKANSLLQKVEAQTPITIMQKVKGKDGKIETAKLAATMLLRYGIVDAAPNPALNDSVFTFAPPPGASEQKDVNDLLRDAGAGPKL